MSRDEVQRLYKDAQSNHLIRDRLANFQSTKSAAFYARTIGFNVNAKDFDSLPLSEFITIGRPKAEQVSQFIYDDVPQFATEGIHMKSSTLQRTLSVATSSFQGLISGLSIGYFGYAALPFLVLTIPLDFKAIVKWKLIPNKKDPTGRIRLAGSAIASMSFNAIFSLFGIMVMGPVSPIGTTTREQYFKVITTPVVYDNVSVLEKKTAVLLGASAAFWLDSQQKSMLLSKQETIASVKAKAKADQALYAEGIAITNLDVNENNYTEILNGTSGILANPRAALVLPRSLRMRIAKKAKESLSLAEAKERERISRLPRKYKATMTNCFIDAPCESFQLVATLENDTVRVGDVTCRIKGEGPDSQGYGACAVVMDGDKPMSMRRWDPTDGFETTRVVFGSQVKEGTYNPELEGNPYMKRWNQRMREVMEQWGREKENARRNCKGLKGEAWTICAGAQTGD